jgi:hypothetical protein
MQTNTNFSYLTKFFLKWEIFRAEVVEKTEKHILCSKTGFRKRRIYDLMWKNIVEPGSPDDNMAHAHCMLIIKATNTRADYYYYYYWLCSPARAMAS